MLTTHIEQQRKLAASAKHQVMQLLQWNDLQYGTFQYETGIEYLKHYLPEDTVFLNCIIREKIFWNWWKAHWTARDQSFIADGVEKLKLQKRKMLYQHVHDAYILSQDIYPSKIVLGTSYAEMIGKIIDKEVAWK